MDWAKGWVECALFLLFQFVGDCRCTLQNHRYSSDCVTASSSSTYKQDNVRRKEHLVAKAKYSGRWRQYVNFKNNGVYIQDHMTLHPIRPTSASSPP
jgi:hypothetical protein